MAVPVCAALEESKREFAPLRIAARFKVLLWILLLALTTGIFLYPATFEYEYHPVQPLHIFHALPLFAALYCLWLLILLVLMFSRGELLEKLVLVGLFALVFYGYWAVSSAGDYPRGDGIWQAGTVRDLAEQGHLDFKGNPGYLYTDFPGLHIRTYAVWQVSGMNLLQSIALVVVFNILLYAAILYWLSVKSLGIGALAGLATILGVQGNLIAAELNHFHPVRLGVVLVATLAALLYSAECQSARIVAHRLAILTILAALACTHLVSAMAAVSILMAMYLLRNRRAAERFSVGTVLLAVMLPLIWMSYAATFTLDQLGDIVNQNVKNDPVSALPLQWGRQLGGSLPAWVTSLQTFWTVALGIPVLLVPFLLLHWRRLAPLDRMDIKALLGILILSGALLAFSPTGIDQIRYLVYGPMFAVLIGLKFLLRQAIPWRGILLACLVLMVFALSLPTFLANNRNAAIHRFYPSDESVGQFLEGLYGNGEGITVFQGQNAGMELNLYRAKIVKPTEEPQIRDRDALWEDMDKLLMRYDTSEVGTKFLYSRRLVVPFKSTQDIEPSDPNWQKFRDRLETHTRFYDNGNVVVYNRS